MNQNAKFFKCSFLICKKLLNVNRFSRCEFFTWKFSYENKNAILYYIVNVKIFNKTKMSYYF